MYEGLVFMKDVARRGIGDLLSLVSSSWIHLPRRGCVPAKSMMIIIALETSG